MHPDVPPGAALLLAFISRTETGRFGAAAYNTIYGHNETKLKTPITTWTLDQVEADGPRRTKAYGSSAAGAYQFMRATLRGLRSELKLSGKELFAPGLQDLMAYHLLKRRGYLEFAAGRKTATAFAKALAQEWASLPVLAATQGSKRGVARGQSYYAGDGRNKALVKPEAVEQLLADVLAAGAPKTKPAPTNWVAALVAALITFLKGFRR